MQPDFSRLYRELGLQPDCSLDAFRQAYRRRVSVQHPDRPDARVQAQGALALSDLIALHDQALQFHRRHGRLPGAAGLARMDADASDASREGLPAWSDPPRSGARVPVAHAPPPDRPAVSRPYVVALALAAVVLIVISLVQAPDQDAKTPPAAARIVRSATPAAAGPSQLALGMDAATVRAIQGEPMHIHDGAWDYGPSWLKFKRGKLVDWYSSPLRQLKAPTTVPVVVATQPVATELQ